MHGQSFAGWPYMRHEHQDDGYTKNSGWCLAGFRQLSYLVCTYDSFHALILTSSRNEIRNAMVTGLEIQQPFRNPAFMAASSRNPIPAFHTHHVIQKLT